MPENEIIPDIIQQQSEADVPETTVPQPVNRALASYPDNCNFIVDPSEVSGRQLRMFSRYSSGTRAARTVNYRSVYDSHRSFTQDVDDFVQNYDDRQDLPNFPTVLSFLTKNSPGNIFYCASLTRGRANHPEYATEYSQYLTSYNCGRNVDLSLFNLEDYSFTKNENYLIIDSTNIGNKNTYYVSQYNSYMINGEKVYSKLPLEIIGYMRDVIDLTSLISKPDYSTFTQDICKKMNPNARTDRFLAWKDFHFSMGTMGDVTFANEDTLIPSTGTTYGQAFSSLSTAIKVLSFGSVYRGSSPVEWESKTKFTSALFGSPNFLLYKIKYQALNQDTGALEEITVINSLVTLPSSKVVKYKRALNFFPTFFRKVFSEKGLALTNPEAYEQILATRFSDNLVYWDMLSRIFGSRVTEDNFSMTNKTFSTPDKQVTDSDITHLSKYSKALNDPSIANYNAAKEAFDNVKGSLAEAEAALVSSTSSLARTEERLESYRNYISQLTEDANRYKSEIKTATSSVEGYKPAIDSLTLQLNELEAARENSFNKLLEISESDDTTSFLKNMADSGVVVTDIEYTIPSIYELKLNWCRESIILETFGSTLKTGVASIKDHPELALYARLNKPCTHIATLVQQIIDSDETSIPEGYYDILLTSGCIPKIRRIKFHTKKPVVIKVDYASKGEDCIKRVGGPYEVEIDYESSSIDSYYRSHPTWRTGGQWLRVRLNSTDAVFGYDSSNHYLWTHPHTQYRYFQPSTSTWESFTQILSQWTNGCLGDISPTINSAYEQGDIKVALFAAMSWLTSANSTDTWGRNHTKFPLLSDVTLDSKEDLSEEDKANEHSLTTEEGMEDSILDLISTLETPDEQVPEITTRDFAPATMENIHQEIQVVEAEIEEQEEEQEVPTPTPQTATITLNRNSGYTSYAQIVGLNNPGIDTQNINTEVNNEA